MGQQRSDALDQITGTLEMYEGTWWAICREYPVASFGATESEAIGKLLNAVRLHQELNEGSSRRTTRRLQDNRSFSLELAGV